MFCFRLISICKYEFNNTYGDGDGCPFGGLFVGLDRSDRIRFGQKVLDVQVLEVLDPNCRPWFKYFGQMLGQVRVDRFDERQKM